MSYKFEQCYQCGDKQFHNIYQAFNHQKLTGHFPHFVIDENLVKALQGFRKPPNLTSSYIKGLMITRLKALRKKYRKMKLMYSGGTDSYTILKLCVDNDIFIDETITQMISMNNDIRTNLEYFTGLRMIKKYEGTMIGKVTELHPTDRDLDFVKDTYWFCDPIMVPGANLPWRPYSLRKMVRCAKDDDDLDTIVLLGYEKPRILVEDKKPYWVINDASCGEMMGSTNTIPFFHDKENPELTVALTYVMLDNLKINGYKSGTLLGYHYFEKSTKMKLLKEYGFAASPHNFINMALLGKTMYNFNRKTKRFYEELRKEGKEDFIEAMFATHDRIIGLYQNVPHAIQIEGRTVKSIGRYSQKIPILQDKFAS